MAAVARELADEFRVVEPFQRGSGPEPSTVARHVADLHQLVAATGERPALVGSSWGAMLALAYAVEHPGRSSSLVLVGSGTFDLPSRKRFRELFDARTTSELRRHLGGLAGRISDPDELLRARGEAVLPLFSHDPLTSDLEFEPCDARAHSETWADMLRLQRAGLYPAAFAAITEDVLMLHGEDDPHPGRMIHASLRPFVQHIEYHEWPRCGHYPWIEAAVRGEFFARLRAWMNAHAVGPG
jgi:pimeloyl-ACP methyl ester carboxylesterase